MIKMIASSPPNPRDNFCRIPSMLIPRCCLLSKDHARQRKCNAADGFHRAWRGLNFAKSRRSDLASCKVGEMRLLQRWQDLRGLAFRKVKAPANLP